MNAFKKNGLKKILIRYGTGNTRRFIPVHKIYEKLGNSVSSVLLKAHVLTGCDLTSKIGTKERVLKACAEPFLQTFGNNDSLTHEDIKSTEQYLIKVYSPNSKCSTFDKLRYECYVHIKTLVY